MRVLLLLVSATLALGACERPPATPTVTVERPWVRLPAASGGTAAAYFTLGASGKDDRLLGIDSSGGRVELHESMTANGMSSMRPLRDVALPAGDPVEFEPGGKHAMIFGLPSALKPGDTVELSFRFAVAPPVTVQATLVGPGEEAPEHGVQ